MKLIRFNPAHKHLFSEDFIKGFDEGAKRQYEATQDQIAELIFNNFSSPNHGVTREMARAIAESIKEVK